MDYFLSERVLNQTEILGFKGWKYDDPPKQDPLWFEHVDEESWANFFYVYWSVPLYTGTVYLLCVFFLQSYMKSKKPFQLKKTLFLWNMGLGIFSMMGFLRTVPELYTIVTSGPDGFVRSICNR